MIPPSSAPGLTAAPPPSAPAASTPHAAPTAPAAPAATETVTRPDPGLARGRWEAPAWAFWAALAVIVACTALYVLRQRGALKRGGDAAHIAKGPRA